MKVDMFWIWMAAIVCVVVFQSYFTETKGKYDVSYMFRKNVNTLPTFGQAALVATGDIDWADIKVWLKENLIEEGSLVSDDPVELVVLAVNKRGADRYFKPFWATN